MLKHRMLFLQLARPVKVISKRCWCYLKVGSECSHVLPQLPVLFSQRIAFLLLKAWNKTISIHSAGPIFIGMNGWKQRKKQQHKLRGVKMEKSHGRLCFLSSTDGGGNICWCQTAHTHAGLEGCEGMSERERMRKACKRQQPTTVAVLCVCVHFWACAHVCLNVCEHVWFVCEADSCASVYVCVKVTVLCTADRLTE